MSAPVLEVTTVNGEYAPGRWRCTARGCTLAGMWIRTLDPENELLRHSHSMHWAYTKVSRQDKP